MKVVLINGSPHKNGNTHDMLEDITRVLHEEGRNRDLLDRNRGKPWMYGLQ